MTIRIVKPDGSFFDLDEKTSENVQKLATERGWTLHEAIEWLFKKGYDAIFSKN